MSKSFRSEKGNTLILVLGFIVAATLMVAPLLARVNVGMLQSTTGSHAEQAYSMAESASAIYTRLFEEAAQSGLQAQDLRALAASLEASLKSNGVVEHIAVRNNGNGDPIAVEFTARWGSGSRERERVVILQLNPPASEPGGGGGTGPSSGSTGEEFYHKHGVVMNKDDFNRVFAACGAESPSENFIENNYDRAKFAEEFRNYIDFYFDDALLPDYVPKGVSSINDKVTQNRTHTIYASGAGVKYAGDIDIVRTWNSMTIDALPDGVAIEAAGDLEFSDYVSQPLTIGGHVRVGGDMAIGGGKKIHIKGDLLVKGDIEFDDNIDEIIIEGDLLVGGELTFESLKKLVVRGDLITGGSTILDDTTQDLQVGGAFVSGSSILIDRIHRIEIGRDMIAAGDIRFSGVVSHHMLVGGYMAALRDIRFSNNIHMSTNVLGGFYAGRNTIFPEWYANNGRVGTDAICIDYFPSGTGGGADASYGIGGRSSK
ncbi:hypothetical protein [Paenibacillus abyssi]|uniref:Uncharacterized protein n=1 Tax=Paenibacillus abyssi TaxID=1340531 RepID=A0A917G515_9BACL|nr:hypothetical protein [Paenibacillus abyssi]GGG23481.1 hypothetical protein GCM10010916_45070 [Paenibacillus abyssi]